MDNLENVLCTTSHEWILQLEDNTAIVGVTPWQINNLGDIVFVELPEVNSTYFKDEVFATIESVKNAVEVFLPVAGKVVDVNETLINSPELLSEAPFENWLVKIEPDDFSHDSDDLIEYQDYIEDVD